MWDVGSLLLSTIQSCQRVEWEVTVFVYPNLCACGWALLHSVAGLPWVLFAPGRWGQSSLGALDILGQLRCEVQCWPRSLPSRSAQETGDKAAEQGEGQKWDRWLWVNHCSHHKGNLQPTACLWVPCWYGAGEMVDTGHLDSSEGLCASCRNTFLQHLQPKKKVIL